jgi:AraC family transcriptional regulator
MSQAQSSPPDSTLKSAAVRLLPSTRADATLQGLHQPDSKLPERMLDPAQIAHIVAALIDGDRLELLPHFAKADPLIYQIAIALKAELAVSSADRAYSNALTGLLSAHLIRHYPMAAPAPAASQSLSGYQLEQAIAYIHDHLNQAINLAHLAKFVGISQFYFCRLFKRSMQITPYQYILQRRIERAKQLLQERQFPISDIALQCGFANQSHFTRQFKRMTGITPFRFLK